MTVPSEPELAQIPRCSLIMKGGITSGVIYPRLAYRLSRDYRFRSIGGSSAGAIAAAATSVAELRRLRDGSDAGFEALDELPGSLTEQVGGRSRLLSLFQPAKETAPLFSVLLSVLDVKQQNKERARNNRPARGVGLAVLLALSNSYRLRTLLGALPGLLLLTMTVVSVLRLTGQDPAAGITVPAIVLGVVSVLGAMLLLCAGVLVAVGLGVRRTIVREVTRNNFGLCSGMGGSEDSPALTVWLHDYLQQMSGQSDPVTFGDLSRHGLALKMMTTNLTQGRPMAMPWSERTFFFDPKVWRSLFPAPVVDWMIAHPSTRVEPTLAARAGELGLAPLPEPEDLPIIVGVRMSLSFPFLISAIPLESVDYARSSAPFRTNWFTDGGLCANLPVQFFDRPLPSSPTFAIDLQATSRAVSEPSGGSYLPMKNTDGLTRRWTSWRTTDEGALGSFVGAMIGTWQGWVDNEALRLPGYRDRVVTIYTTADEGGMNLNMDAKTVAGLASRGQAAAEKLVSKFTGPFGDAPNNGFDNHRWIRLRSALAAISEWLEQFGEDFGSVAGGASFTFEEMIRLGPGGPLPSYNKGDMASIERLANELKRVADGAYSMGVARGAPRPSAKMRLVPDDR